MARKKLENMTTDERIEHYQKQREAARMERQTKLDHLSQEQRDSAKNLFKVLDDVLETAMYPDMCGGIKAVSAYELQELYDLTYTFSTQFNLRD